MQFDETKESSSWSLQELKFVGYISHLGLVHTIELEVESESKAQGALQSSLNQKVELEAESEAQQNRSQKDQKGFFFFRFCFASVAADPVRTRWMDRKWKRNYQPIKKLITNPFQT